MICAFLNGMIGTSLTFFISMKILEFGFLETLLCIIGANIAALVGVLLTLQAERISKFRETWLNNSLKTWTFLTLIYCAINLSMSPPLRTLKAFIYLFIPLLLSTGFAIIAFGPIQDILVRRQQKKSSSQIEKSEHNALIVS